MERCAVLLLVTFSLLAGAPDLAQVTGGGPTPREALQAELLRMGKEDQQHRAEFRTV